MKPRDEQKIEQIFAATVLLVAKNGLVGVTISDIAKEAGIATGTLYIYFAGKDELIRALFIKLKESLAHDYLSGYHAEEPFKVGFKKVWMNILDSKIKRFDENVFVEQCYRSPFISEQIKRQTEQMLLPLFNLIERGKNEGLIKLFDTFLLLTYMVGSITELVNLSKYSGEDLKKETIESAFLLCWDGLKA